MNTSDSIIAALQQQNLVYNYNFLYFSNQSNKGGTVAYNHPDGWIYKDTGTDGSIGLFQDACRITTGSEEGKQMIFKQALHEFPRWQSKLINQTISAKAEITINKGISVIVSLDNGIEKNSHTIITQEEALYSFELQLFINPSTEKLYISIETNSSNATLDVHKVYANIGLVAIETLPCVVNGIIGERKQYIATATPPAQELSICQSAQELNANQTRLNSVLNNRFGTGENGFSMLPDVRGYFSRAWNNESTIDKNASTRKMLGNDSVEGDLVGTEEEDLFKEHQHELNYQPTTAFLSQSGSSIQGVNTTLSSQTEKTGGEETRPINVAELFTIKWA